MYLERRNILINGSAASRVILFVIIGGSVLSVSLIIGFFKKKIFSRFSSTDNNNQSTDSNNANNTNDMVDYVPEYTPPLPQAHIVDQTPPPPYRP
ncbi:hypothetical protein CONCODRAFT_78842, partial [Conidiobolus coronatus NRRL 28638]